MYVAGTLELRLRYDRCQAGDRGGDKALAFSRAMSAIEVFRDASFAPAGARSHQGLLGMYGEGLIQWEATRQPFAALSAAEAELVGLQTEWSLETP